MTGNVCPKCGSTEIFNNECLKCGVLISKVKTATPSVETTSQVSISFVSPGSVTQPPSVTTSGRVLQPVAPAKSGSGFTAALKRSDTQTNMIGGVVLLLLIGGAYFAYRHFVGEASYYNGFYWNMAHRFAMDFPEKVWRHMDKEDVAATGYKDAIDGFFLGRDVEKANVLLIIWAERREDVAPERFDEDIREAMLAMVEEKLQYRMLGSKVEYEITEEEDTRLDGNDGFVLQADVKKDFEPLKATIYCPFFENYSYMMMFVGKEQQLAKNDEQIRALMRTYNYREKLLM